MQFLPKPSTGKGFGSSGSTHEFHFLIEPEPWLKIFLRNLRDAFRPAPPRIWLTARPAEYWADALVHRPVAWTAIRQSFFLHALFAVSVYGLNLLWLARPRVIEPATPRTTIAHYELSPYLPAINSQPRPQPPTRERAQKADPEYAQQEIVSLNAQHDSLRQTIVHPNPALLRQDVPLPNLIATIQIPAAPVAARDRIPIVPVEAPQVVAPAERMTARNMSRLVFPLAARPEVVPPAGDVSTTRAIPVLPLNSPVVVPPVEPIAARDPRRLQLPPQSPDVVAPASAIATRNRPVHVPPQAKPEVVPPPENAVARNLASFTLPPEAQSVAPPPQRLSERNLAALALPAQSQMVVPPAGPVAAGDRLTEQALGQLLALNAQPVAPAGPVTVPEATRRGEFAASPAGHIGATGAPEIKAADRAPAETAKLFVAAPPSKITASAVVAAPLPPPKLTASLNSTDVPPDQIDRQVFGGRRNYAIKLSMPNINSTFGSWIIRFAELKPEDAARGELSTPEPIHKVDPAYPASLIHDHVEGVVVLHALIRSDGSVADVRVLEGFDPRLDENARVALSQWRFRPGTRNGVPVDVEAVVRVPFRAPKSPF